MDGVNLFNTIVMVGAVLFVTFIVWAIPVRLWVAAYAAGVKVSIGTLIGMRLRRVPPASVVLPLINATMTGLDIDIGALEAHYLAGGRVDRVVAALISSYKANIELDFNGFISWSIDGTLQQRNSVAITTDQAPYSFGFASDATNFPGLGLLHVYYDWGSGRSN